MKVVDVPAKKDVIWNGLRPDPGTSSAPWRIYNIGNNEPIDLIYFISEIEAALGRKAYLKMLPMQLGDVPDTFADVSDLTAQFDYRPETKVKEGIQRFVTWYKGYFNV